MIEEVLVTARHNAKDDPSLGIWTWEIAFYLFMGGMAAGIMLFAAWAVLARRDEALPFAHDRFALWAPIALSLGMTTLFLDLEYKIHVFRFYTTFQPASPMSWGSWVLVLVYPLSIALITATFRRGYPNLSARLERLPLIRPLLDISEDYRRPIAFVTIPIAIALGIYTGILLSTFSARPFWNSAILGPLFLVSGLSAAAAMIILGARDKLERTMFAQVDIWLIAVELLLVALLIVGLASGSEAQLHALELVMSGPYALVFWGVFITVGLALPLLLEIWEIRGGARALVLVAPLLVLLGGYALRHVTLDLGQASTWQEYTTQYDPALLERLK